MKPEYSYIGRDAFDESYKGFVPFSNGSWITEEAAYDAAAGKVIVPAGKPEPSEEYCQQMDEQVRSFVEINNLILETDYYQQTGHPEQ